MANYELNYTGKEVDALLNKIDTAFGEITVIGDTLTWDGNTDGLANVLGIFYRVSDVVPSLEDLQNGGEVYITSGAGYSFDSTNVMNLSDYGMGDNAILIVIGDVGYYVGVALTDGATATVQGTSVTFEKAGTYFLLDTVLDSYTKAFTINGFTGFETIKTEKIPSRFISQPEPTAVYRIKSSAVGDMTDREITCDKTLLELNKLPKEELSNVVVIWNESHIIKPIFVDITDDAIVIWFILFTTDGSKRFGIEHRFDEFGTYMLTL